MPIAALPYWPPSAADRLAEDQVRRLFRYPRTVIPPVMAEGKRRIREIIGPEEPICIHHPTVKTLTDTRLGTFEVMQIISLSAGSPMEEYYVRFLIGLHQDGALMVTPTLNPSTHLEWERWAVPSCHPPVPRAFRVGEADDDGCGPRRGFGPDRRPARARVRPFAQGASDHPRRSTAGRATARV